LWRRRREASAYEIDELLDGEALRQHYRFADTLDVSTGQELERTLACGLGRMSVATMWRTAWG
jgi:hypothetical protein